MRWLLLAGSAVLVSNVQTTPKRRRAADVIMVTCTDCSREQTIAIAKLAAKP